MTKKNNAANIRRRNKAHAKKERGHDLSSGKKNNSYTVGPVLLGFFLFVVVGSAVIGIINSAQQQPLVPGAGAGAAGGQ